MRVTVTTNTKTLTEIVGEKYPGLLKIKEAPGFNILIQNKGDATIYINQDIDNDDVVNGIEIESNGVMTFNTDIFNEIILASEGEDNDNVRLFITRK